MVGREPSPRPLARSLGRGRIRAARAEGQGLLLETVALILGKRHGRSDTGTQERLQWLAPILQQNEAIGASYKQRRTPSDVNADTGEEVPTTQAP